MVFRLIVRNCNLSNTGGRESFDCLINRRYRCEMPRLATGAEETTQLKTTETSATIFCDFCTGGEVPISFEKPLVKSVPVFLPSPQSYVNIFLLKQIPDKFLQYSYQFVNLQYRHMFLTD